MVKDGREGERMRVTTTFVVPADHCCNAAALATDPSAAWASCC